MTGRTTSHRPRRRHRRPARTAVLLAARPPPARRSAHRIQRSAGPGRHRPRHRPAPPATGGLHLVLRAGHLRSRGPRTRPDRRRRRPQPHPQRPRRALLQNQKQVDDKVAKILDRHTAKLITVTTGVNNRGTPTLTWCRNAGAITAAAALDGLYALATNLPDPPERPLTAADVLDLYKDQWIVEQRHRDLKQTLHVRPVFLHNDDRIHALIAVTGIALLIYGLIEADLRAALGPNTALPGLLPEGRDAIPTARAVLTAFTDLHATYTTAGLTLDRLTPTQRLILAHLDIPLPWPETPTTPTKLNYKSP
jgi:hypothetical protein